MEEVLDVYERPYNGQHPVVCLDESPKQLISQKQKALVVEAGVVYQDYEYKREGVADLYMLVEPLGGRGEALVREDHTSRAYAEVVAYMTEQMYPQAKKVTLVEDNHSAHKLSTLHELYEPERARAIVGRIEVVRTPKHGSWLNIAECELSVLTRQGLGARVPSIEELDQQARQWYQVRNEKQKRVDWQFTAKDAGIKLKRLYPTIST